MTLLTAEQRIKLLENGANPDCDHPPVCHLQMTDVGFQWLLSEIVPDEPNIAFGLCDLGYPELGYVDLGELAEVKGPRGRPVANVPFFKAGHPMSVYAQAAREMCHITVNADDLKHAAETLKRKRPRNG